MECTVFLGTSPVPADGRSAFVEAQELGYHKAGEAMKADELEEEVRPTGIA